MNGRFVISHLCTHELCVGGGGGGGEATRIAQSWRLLRCWCDGVHRCMQMLPSITQSHEPWIFGKYYFNTIFKFKFLFHHIYAGAYSYLFYNGCGGEHWILLMRFCAYLCVTLRFTMLLLTKQMNERKKNRSIIGAMCGALSILIFVWHTYRYSVCVVHDNQKTVTSAPLVKIFRLRGETHSILVSFDWRVVVKTTEDQRSLMNSFRQAVTVVWRIYTFFLA